MKNILIIRFSSLGDLVTLEPTFRAMRYFFKDSNISFLTTNIGKNLYEDSGYFDDFIIHKNVFTSIKNLKTNNYDIVINLQCTKPSHYVNLFLNKKKTINKSFNLFQKIFRIKTHTKSIQEILSLADIEQHKIQKYFETEDEKIKLPVSKSKFIINNVGKPIVAISTGTSERWLSKKWGITRFIDLVDKLLTEDFHVVLVGSSLEAEDAKLITKKFNNIDNFVNKTNLTQLKNLLAEVDLFIGNDSGPTHIAAAVGTNTITIFGSTDIKHCVKFIPYRGQHEYLKPSEDIKCHPCYKTKCPTNMECMESIKVNDVFLKVKNRSGYEN